MLVTDSDAHMVETERTWASWTPEEERFRPRIVQDLNAPTRQHWVIEREVPPLHTPTEMQQEAG